MGLMGYKQFWHLKYGLDLVECNTREEGIFVAVRICDDILLFREFLKVESSNT